MNDPIHRSLHGLLCDGGPITLALSDEHDVHTCVAAVLGAVTPAAVRASTEGKGSVSPSVLVDRLQGRFTAAVQAGEVSPRCDLEELAVFYTSIVVGLITEALGGGDHTKMEAVRRLAIGIWPIHVAEEPA